MTWAYAIEVVDDTNKQMERVLAERGDTGWELVAAFPRWHHPSTVRLIFKKEI